ncbi:MAG: Rne/Rng family ribonuclease, partial [Gammaproteobacteria bacterium]|nr:Rne/Rng family ribonuclease [Gammaproteobacteria bacterium]NIQ10035.1 Rne/Rng family ribonuclease [Gammaproteobacteria bacterium]NIR25454.1 Rne/Rng family ribonuclease [Gammaproteobacteria bacterium]NIY19643.1 Rne/Rng family ribonuclease [Gammaproteobacteria bacterium]
MSKKMLMNATQHEENRVAIVEDGILTELDIEVAGHEPTKGNIYRAVVVRVESGLQAAFVDYGAGRLGFLQIDEINYKAVKPDYQPAEDGRRPRITDLLYRGQELLVQIIKEERGTKGAALTTYLSLAGRYMVIMPGSQTRGVSRKAESDSQRKELKQAMASIDMADNVGYIVRTAALNQSREELERDYLYLIRLYESILDLDKKVKAPALLYKESNLIIRSIRDYFTTDMDEVLIDDQQVFKEARDFFQMVMPDQVKLVKLHQERRPIFSRYQIEDQIEILSRNKVPLPSGGSIVIDPTEALVAIDVNSGKMASEQGVEATATKTNIEAAREVGRQLRLRDLGGLVVIDFIDMRDRKHAREVEKELKKSLENDKARVSVGRISQFGLLEMSRQRIKGALAEGTYLTCPHCQGNGRLKSPETQAAALLRKIHASAAKGQISQINAELPIDVASYLLNDKREDLVEMERDHNLQIHIHGNRDFHADQAELEIVKKEKDQPEQHEFVAAGLLSVPDEESSQEKNGGNAPKEEGNANKKRRRRRRRKPAATSEETQVAQQDTANLQAEASDSEHKEEAEPKKQPEQQEAPAAEQQKKPQRPRRSRSRTKKPEQPADEKVTTDKASPVQEESEKSVQEEKPKRQPGRRKPKAASESQPTEEETKKLEKDAEQPASESQEVTKKPQPRRRHRTPKRTAQADESKSSSENNQGGSETPKEAEEPTEQKKPARRGRRKSTAA